MLYLSALEVCSRQGAIQIHVYLYLYCADFIETWHDIYRGSGHRWGFQGHRSNVNIIARHEAYIYFDGAVSRLACYVQIPSGVGSRIVTQLLATCVSALCCVRVNVTFRCMYVSPWHWPWRVLNDSIKYVFDWRMFLMKPVYSFSWLYIFCAPHWSTYRFYCHR